METVTNVSRCREDDDMEEFKFGFLVGGKVKGCRMRRMVLCQASDGYH